MVDFARLETRIAEDEGFRGEAYQDSLGFWTIGYGTRYLFGQEVTENTPRVTEDVARLQLQADIYQALKRCQWLYQNWHQIDSVRQEVLGNMSYNIGSKLTGFKRMNRAVRALDYTAWQAEMVDSLWYSQVKGRAVRLRNAVRRGAW